jgi:hypothetical protein
MATFEYTLTDADMGATIGPPDAFVVNLKRTKAGPYDPPSFSEATQQFTTGRFVLRATGEFRNFVCIDTQTDGYWASQYGNTASVLINASLGYRGELMIVCVPKGSVWELTLSDQPYVRAPVTNWLDALAKRVNDQREAILVGR